MTGAWGGNPTTAHELQAGVSTLTGCPRADTAHRGGGGPKYSAPRVAKEISEPVRRFIAQHVHSAAQLEVLLLLRAVPDREWSEEDVARAQVSTPGMAAQLLEDLRTRDLVSADGAPRRYRYAPPPALVAVVDDLAEAYATRRVTVVGLIFSKPSPAVTGLAEAFRFRKDR